MSLAAITIYIEAGSSGQPVFATVAPLHYLHPVSLFHMQQPYQCLLTLVVITRVPRIRYESDSVGLQETFTTYLIACWRDRNRLEKYFMFPMCMNSRLTFLHVSVRTVTSSWQYDSWTRLLSKGSSDLWLLYHSEKIDPLLAHLIHTIIRYVRDWTYVF